MKKTITSAGLVVLGAATLHAQRTPYAPAPGLTSQELSKLWSVSASLRAFYDDNYATRPSGPGEDSAVGLEFTPTVSVNWSQAQTYLGLSYTYGYRWYNDRIGRDYDQMHHFDANLSHTFSERYRLDVKESFASAQEPDLIDKTGGAIIPIRTEGDNIHNYVSVGFTADLTEQLGAYAAYSNDYYNYDDRGRPGSYSALLDRLSHLVTLNLRWQALPTTVGILGYQYGVTDYTSGDPLGIGSPFIGDDRDSDSHYIYVGADHSFNDQLEGSVRVGAQFTDYDKFNKDTTSPYVDGSLSYIYAPDSYVQGGVRHARNATDIATAGAVSPVLDQETTTVYGNVTHQITGKLAANCLAQVQFSDFEGGGFDGKSETFFMAGLNLTYSVNEFLTAETGYNYDRLSTDVPNRDYSRNRVYVGIRATY